MLGGAVVLDNADARRERPRGRRRRAHRRRLSGHGRRAAGRPTVITSDSSVRADATRRGDGGRMIVADGTTRYSRRDLPQRAAPPAATAVSPKSGQGATSLSGHGGSAREGRGQRARYSLDPTDVRIVADTGTQDVETVANIPTPGSPIVCADTDPDSNDDGTANDLDLGERRERHQADIVIAATDDIAVETDITLNANQSISLTAGDDVFIGVDLSGAPLRRTGSSSRLRPGRHRSHRGRRRPRRQGRCRRRTERSPSPPATPSPSTTTSPRTSAA